MQPQNQETWHDGVPTSGGSYLVHRFAYTVLAGGSGSQVNLYSSKCGSVAVKAIDSDPALLAISDPCKRCFKP